jgi:mRNA-degrading endonuclease RelE of RelBE toxin-antitoxin system
MKVRITDSAARDFDGLPLVIKVRVLRCFERLASWPAVSGVKPLAGSLAGHFRLRTGDYRVQFRVEREAVVVERVGHRDGFYDER